MQVVILCGGMGTRLREETEFRPKPMVKIGERPILWHIMKIFSCFGLRDFVLPLGYKGESIKEYFFNYDLMNHDIRLELGRRGGLTRLSRHHEEEDWNIVLAETGAQALKGARLKRIERYVSGSDVLVTYGDGVANIDVERLVAFHRAHGRIATVTGVSPTARFGELSYEGDRVTAFQEKPSTSPGTRLISGGFFVFKTEIFDYLRDEDGCDLEHGTLDDLAEEGELMLFRHDGFWACMDTLRDMEYLNRLWAEDRAAWKIWKDRF